jgi:tRNA threonylcarbamoyladenosine biosynthesis protein TsaB
MFRGFTENAGKEEAGHNRFYCPMLDARRMEVYYALYDCEGNTLKNISAEIINEGSFMEIPLSKEIVFFGEGALKLREVIKRPNIRFEENFKMSAAHLFAPSYKALKEGKLENIAYFEPLYLKDFITTKQKKNILGI